jgi:hypothetical protein
MPHKHVILTAIILLVMAVSPLSAAPKPKPGFVKVLVMWTDFRPDRVPAVAAEFGGEEVAEYTNYRVIALPSKAADVLSERFAARGLRISRGDDFDVISLPGGKIDTRRGIEPGIPLDSLISSYGPTTGLFVVQFIGPTLPEWLRDVEKHGGTVLDPVPAHAHLVGLTDTQAASVDRLPFVQWVSPFHPAFKTTPRNGNSTTAVDVEIAALPEANATISELNRLGQAVEGVIPHRNSTIRRYVLSPSARMAALRLPAVIGIFDVAVNRLSDERQVMSTTNNVDTFWRPMGATTYKTWLDSKCGVMCGNLDAQGFRVGIADNGIGADGDVQHPDLNGRVRFGENFVRPHITYPPTPTYPASESNADFYGHGTMVAGIIAGNATTLVRDQAGAGYYTGMGVVPTAGILSTKIANFNGAIYPNTTTNNILKWAEDATKNGVRIQNHSHNTHLPASLEGVYTNESVQYDQAVRDSNGNAQDGLTPITLVVSAGNMDKLEDGSARKRWVTPPATAKNVISVGLAHTYREPGAFECRNGGMSGFKNISAYSKHGTAISSVAPDGQVRQWSTYIKPDLIAVGANSFSTLTPFKYSTTPPSPTGICPEPGYDPYDKYAYGTGTSYAAPIASGAALLAQRVYSQWLRGYADPAATSPSLTKAMLVGSARSMEGGEDWAVNYDEGGYHRTLIGPRPNDVQGFGLVSTTDILDVNLVKSYVNESHTFTSSNELGWTAIYYRRNHQKPVRVALAWTDAPAPVAQTVPLVNDLDLYVDAPYKLDIPAGTTGQPCAITYYGNNGLSEDHTYGQHCLASAIGYGQDIRNNVELVSIQPWRHPASNVSMLTVRVQPKKIEGRAKPNHVAVRNQDFSLFVTNASQRGDFDHDGKVDVVEQTGTVVSVRSALGAAQQLTTLLATELLEAVGDFDKDGNDDLVIRDTSTGRVFVRRLSRATGTLGDVEVGTASLDQPVVGAGDFDRDGSLDLLLRSQGLRTVPWDGDTNGRGNAIWFLNGTSIKSVQYTVQYSSGISNSAGNWYIEGVADFDGDGWPDVLWRNYDSGSPWYGSVMIEYTWYSGQSKSSRVYPAMPGSTYSVVAVGDYDNDGRNDILWQATYGGLLLWQYDASTNGTFNAMSVAGGATPGVISSGPR